MAHPAREPPYARHDPANLGRFVPQGLVKTRQATEQPDDLAVPAPWPQSPVSQAPVFEPAFWIELPAQLSHYARVGLFIDQDEGKCLLLRIVRDLGNPDDHANLIGSLAEMRDFGQVLINLCNFHDS
jgi:hypothetical protein